MKNFLLVTVSTLASLGALELGLQLYYPLQVKTYECPETTQHQAYDREGQCPTSQDRISAMRFSPDLLYTPVPNAFGEGWATDEYGFRLSGASIDYSSSEPSLKIAITGGSTAWGVGVADAQTVSAQIQKIVTNLCPDRRIVVWNAAISAQTSGQERRRFETSVLPLSPDIHIALTGFNDVYNAYTGLYPHQNRDYFDVAKMFGISSVDDFVPQPPNPANYSLRLLYVLERARYNLSVDQEFISAATERRLLPYDQTIDSVIRNAEVFGAWSERYGHEFYYALQPSIYHSQKTMTEGEIAIQQSDYDFGVYHKEGYLALLTALARDNLGFHFIDTDNAIKNEASELFIDNVHFGDRGYRLIAQYLTEEIWKKSKKLQDLCGQIPHI